MSFQPLGFTFPRFQIALPLFSFNIQFFSCRLRNGLFAEYIRMGADHSQITEPAFVPVIHLIAVILFVAILIALFTVSFHAIKAATANPISSLRNE